MSRAAIHLSLMCAGLALGCGEDLRLGRVGEPSSGAAATSLAIHTTHSCALTEDGRVFCFGSNLFTQLGHERFGDFPPAEVPGVEDAVQLVAGLSFNCVLHADASVSCWGGDYVGQLGRGGAGGDAGTRAEHALPMRVVAPAARAIFAGADSACLVTPSDQVFCWGKNDSGQVDPSSTDAFVSIPSELVGIEATHVALGDQHTCVHLRDQRVLCFGANDVGQLGDGTNVDSRVPVEPIGLGPVDAIAVVDVRRDAARGTSCALRPDATVLCWGHDDAGQAGNGSSRVDSSIPAPVLGLAGTVELVTGQRAVLARSSAGTWRAWGYNGSNALGLGASSGNLFEATRAPLLDRFDVVDLAFHHGCGLEGSTVYCWGTSSYGSLPGVESGTEVSEPLIFPLL